MVYGSWYGYLLVVCQAQKLAMLEPKGGVGTKGGCWKMVLTRPSFVHGKIDGVMDYNLRGNGQWNNVILVIFGWSISKSWS